MLTYWSTFETMMVLSGLVSVAISLIPLRTTQPKQRLIGIAIGVGAIVAALWTSSLATFSFPTILLIGPALYGLWLLTNWFRNKDAVTELPNGQAQFAPNQQLPFNQGQPYPQNAEHPDQFAPGQYGQAPQQPGQFGQAPQQPGQFGQAPQQPGQYGQAPQQPGQHGQSQQQPGQYGPGQQPWSGGAQPNN